MATPPRIQPFNFMEAEGRKSQALGNTLTGTAQGITEGLRFNREERESANKQKESTARLTNLGIDQRIKTLTLDELDQKLKNAQSEREKLKITK